MDVGEVARVGRCPRRRTSGSRARRSRSRPRASSCGRPGPGPTNAGPARERSRPADRCRLPPVELDHVVDAAIFEECVSRRAARRNAARRRAARPGRRCWRRRDGRSGCARSRPRRCAAVAPAASPGSECRLGPANESGEARSEKTGSVSRLMPPIWTSTDGMADPRRRRLHRRAGARVDAQEVEVGRDARRRCLRRARQPLARGAQAPLQHVGEAFRLEASFAVLEALAVAWRGRARGRASIRSVVRQGRIQGRGDR